MLNPLVIRLMATVACSVLQSSAFTMRLSDHVSKYPVERLCFILTVVMDIHFSVVEDCGGCIPVSPASLLCL